MSRNGAAVNAGCQVSRVVVTELCRPMADCELAAVMVASFLAPSATAAKPEGFARAGFLMAVKLTDDAMYNTVHVLPSACVVKGECGASQKEASQSKQHGVHADIHRAHAHQSASFWELDCSSS